jgi:hypothetical protein
MWQLVSRIRILFISVRVVLPYMRQIRLGCCWFHLRTSTWGKLTASAEIVRSEVNASATRNNCSVLRFFSGRMPVLSMRPHWLQWRGM